jgi:hypothetical protein
MLSIDPKGLEMGNFYCSALKGTVKKWLLVPGPSWREANG